MTRDEHSTSTTCSHPPAHTHTHYSLVQLRFRHTIIGHKVAPENPELNDNSLMLRIVRNLKSKNSVQRKSCKGSLLRGSGTLQSYCSRCFLLRTAAKTAPVILMLQMPCMRSTMKTRRTTITSRSLTKYHRHSEAEETLSIPINAPSLLTSSWWEGVHSYVFFSVQAISSDIHEFVNCCPGVEYVRCFCCGFVLDGGYCIFMIVVTVLT